MYKHEDSLTSHQNTTYSHHHNLGEYWEDQQKMPYYAQYMTSKQHGIINIRHPSSHSTSQASSTQSPTHTYSTHSTHTIYHYQSPNGYIPSSKTNKQPYAWMARGTNSI